MTFSRRHVGTLILAAFLLAVCLHGGLLIFGLYGISADESGRTTDAYFWATTGTPQSDVWLPFHRILVGYALLAWNDLFVVPRVISFFAGLLALFLLVWLSHELFDDRRVTGITAILASCFSHRVILSAVPLTEIEFIAVITAATIAYSRWLRLHRPMDMVAAAALIALGTSIRYEGWIFAASFIVLLVFTKQARIDFAKHRTISLAAIILIVLFPLYWTATAYAHSGVLLGFLNANTERYEKLLHLTFPKIVWHNPLVQFIFQNGAAFNLVGVIALLELIRAQRRIRILAEVPVLALLAFSLVEFTGKGIVSHNPWRIIAVWSCLLIPFTAYWIVDYLATAGKGSKLRYYGVPAAIVAAFFVQTLSLARTPAFSESDYTIGKFLREKLEENRGKKVLVEGTDWSYVNIMVASNAPERIVSNTGFDPYSPAPEIIHAQDSIDADNLAAKGFEFLVFKSKLRASSTQKMALSELTENDKWRVYKIVPAGKYDEKP